MSPRTTRSATVPQDTGTGVASAGVAGAPMDATLSGAAAMMYSNGLDSMMPRSSRRHGTTWWCSLTTRRHCSTYSHRSTCVVSARSVTCRAPNAWDATSGGTTVLAAALPPLGAPAPPAAALEPPSLVHDPRLSRHSRDAARRQMVDCATAASSLGCADTGEPAAFKGRIGCDDAMSDIS